MLTPLVQTPDFIVAHDTAAELLFVTWSGRHDPAATAARCAQLLVQVERTHARWLLNDSARSLDGWHEITHWLSADYLPALADRGVRAVAWVNARDWPTRTLTTRMLAGVARPLVDTFADVEAAHAWLQAQRAPAAL